MIEDEDDVVIPELSDEVLEKPEEPPKDDTKEHLLDVFPEAIAGIDPLDSGKWDGHVLRDLDNSLQVQCVQGQLQ